MERRRVPKRRTRRRIVPQQKRTPKTRNMMLFVVCVFVISYTLVEIILGFVSIRTGMIFQLDSTLTTEVFSFAKWVVVSGATITVAKTAKGETNSDEDEHFLDAKEGENGNG